MGDLIITVTAPADEPNALAAALDYAARGWRVIPIKAGGKHPPVPEWQRAATTDPAVITNWWTQLYRGCGVGIATGPASGVWVLDIDISGDKAGDQTLKELEARYGPLPATVTARTGSGGAHLFFACDDDTVRNNQSGKLGPGLDVRGDGGQVVAAPSVHASGARYSWVDGHAPNDLSVAVAPAWLLELLTAEPEPPAEPSADTPRTPSIAPGPFGSDDQSDSIAAWFNDTITWDQLQAVKNALWGEDARAIEVYPAKSDVVNGGNYRHLWRLGAGDFCPDLLGDHTLSNVFDDDNLETRHLAAWAESEEAMPGQALVWAQAGTDFK